MKVFNGIKSTMESIPFVEVNKDTVYVRSNVERIETDEFKGWQYDEVQYSLQEYIEGLNSKQDAESMALLLAMLMGEVDFLRNKIETLEGSLNK